MFRCSGMGKDAVCRLCHHGTNLNNEGTNNPCPPHLPVGTTSAMGKIVAKVEF